MPKSPANLAMAAQIRAERVAASLTQVELADASGINVETLKRILKGERDITVTQIVALAGVFNLLPEQLVARATDRLEQMSAAGEMLSDQVEDRERYALAAQEQDGETGSDEPPSP